MKRRRTEPTPSKTKGRMIHIRLTDSAHKDLRVRVAEKDTTIQEWVEKLIEKALKGKT